ncbi:MAG: hypothetical protein ACJ798_10635 [Phenylobacterium sp.]
MRAVSCLAMVVALAFAQPSEGRGYRPPRTAPGQPDLQGLWTSNSLSRLERPDVYPSVVISEAQARAIPPPPLIAPDATGQAETESYDDGLALARVRGEIRTAWIVDPTDGRLPYTPQGRARANRANTFDGPETRTNQERCLMMPGVGPPLANTLYNNAVQIVQTKDSVALFLEQNHELRIVPLGRRPHGSVARWMGDSVGWWEGDALVIETTNFAPQDTLRSSPLIRLQLSPNAVVTERLQRTSATEILYSYSVVDPANYTRPWRGEMPLLATNGPMYEYACHEGNYSLPNILAGARVQERAGDSDERGPGH